MPDKRPPNAEATQFRSGEEAVENGRKGGLASGQARREKKTIQKILSELLDTNVENIPQMANSLKKMGIKGDKPLKDVFTLIATLNTLKTANLGDLERLSKLLGEQTEYEDNNKDVEETLAVIKECAYADRDKS